jgi:hypothetical protein
MTVMELYDLLETDTELIGVGIIEGDIVIECPSKNHLATRIPVSKLECLDWPTLRAILMGDREPVVIDHMTRVVGYLARVANFNQSKVGELKDRIRGNYSERSLNEKSKAIDVVNRSYPNFQREKELV